MDLFKRRLTKAGMYFVMVFTSVISFYPILWVIMTAFKTNAEILNNPFSLPTSFSFDSFIYVLNRYSFIRYGLNSFLVAASSTLISLFIYAMAGYVFGKFRFPGKGFLFSLFVVTMLIPGMAKIQPIFSLLMKLGLYDNLVGLSLVYVSGGMAMSMFLLRTSFASIPYSLDEAAILDGAGFFRRFWKINVPLAANGLVTAGILMFLGNWNEYYYAAMLTSSETNRTLPISLQFFNETFSYDYSKLFAALTIVILPGLIVYIVAQDRIRVSIATSGVKG